VKAAIAKLKAREADRRKDWVEKTSTDLARRFGVIAVEDLKIANMTRSAKGSIDAPARNIAHAAGHAVSARGGPPLGEPTNRAPQRDLLIVR
jgi:transposase